jgi:hypothetical protein
MRCAAEGIDLIGKELKQGAHQPVWPKVRGIDQVLFQGRRRVPARDI